MSSSVSYHGLTLLCILAFWSFSCEVVNTGSFQQLKCQDMVILNVLDEICEMLHFFFSDLRNEITVHRARGLEVTFRVTEASAVSSAQCAGTTSYNPFHMPTDCWGFCFGVGFFLQSLITSLQTDTTSGNKILFFGGDWSLSVLKLKRACRISHILCRWPGLEILLLDSASHISGCNEIPTPLLSPISRMLPTLSFCICFPICPYKQQM